ncbi:MAG: hypothetical protein WC269_04025 [Candidatus Gracilibacteria bacterium]|jgi:hypothetical protein
MRKFVLLFVLVFVFYLGGNPLYAQDENDGRVYLGEEFLDGNILRVSVFAENVEEPVLGIAFHLIYDSENVAFLRYDPGQFLERGGDPFYLVQNTPESGEIFFGSTLRRDDNFPLGGDKVVDFYFQILTDGEFNFSFKNGVISTLDVVRQDLSSVLWEDAVFERGNSEQIVFSSGGKTSIFPVVDADKKSFIIPVFIVSIAVLSAFLLIYFLKKQEHKRHDSSVNFK